MSVEIGLRNTCEEFPAMYISAISISQSTFDIPNMQETPKQGSVRSG